MVRAVFIEDRVLMLRTLRDGVDWASEGIEPIGFFENCDDALPVILEKKPDVVITDIVMHGMDGLELSELLYARDDNIKVIMISAYSRFEYAQKALQTGVYAYFEKPIDFDALKKSISAAGEERQFEEQLKQYVSNHMAFYRERFFLKLLLGQLEGDEEYTRQEAAFLGIRLGDQNICVTMTMRENENESARRGMRRELLHLMLSRRFLEAYGSSHVFGPFTLREDDMTLILMGCGEEVRDAVQGMVEEFAQANHVLIHAGIGRPAVDFAQIKNSYDTACYAHKAWFGLGVRDSAVILSTELPADENAQWYWFLHFEERMIRSLREEDVDMARAAFSWLCERLEQEHVPGEVLKVLMKSVVLKAESFNLRERGLISETLRSMDAADSISELVGIARAHCLEICDAVRDTHSARRRQLVARLQAYAEENFTNPLLSLNDLAQHISLSPNYLSTTFKKEYGKGIHEYITELRIRKACKLLACTELGIGQIAEEVGYSNPYYFSGSFKKVMNQSPSNYRKQHQQHG